MIKRAKIQMPDGTFKVAKVEVADPTPLQAGVEPLKQAANAVTGALSEGSTADKVAGLALGQPASQAVKNVAEVVTDPGKAIPERVAARDPKELVAGFAMGGAMPSAMKEAVPDVAKAAGGAVKEAVGNTGVANILKGKLSKQGKVDTINQAAAYLEDSYHGAQTKYGQVLKDAVAKKPDQMVDLTEVVDDIKFRRDNRTLEPQLARAINQIPELRNLFHKNRPITAVEADSILSKLQQIGKGKNILKRPIRELHSSVMDKTLESFGELGEAKQEYGRFMDNYRAAKNELLVKDVLGNIEKGYSNPKIEQQINEILPPQAIKELGGYRSAARALKVLMWVGGLAVGGTAAGGAYKILH